VATTRAKAISLSELSNSIDKAVALASKRYGVSVGSDTVIHNWEILGRILRELNNLKPSGPTEVAAAIAKSAGLRGTPVATMIGKDILVGVIARETFGGGF
jgi:phosphopentomutase